MLDLAGKNKSNHGEALQIVHVPFLAGRAGLGPDQRAVVQDVEAVVWKLVCYLCCHPT